MFKDKPYVTLENPDKREFAQNDPKRFLARFPDGAILDEVQRCPSLLSWLQGWVDDRQKMGDFILTRSTQLNLVESITQTLAGRVARIELLPLSAQELVNAGRLPSLMTDVLFQGGYPAIYDCEISPGPNFAVVTGTALTVSRSAGIFVGLGLAIATLTWSLLTIAGIGVIATQFPWISTRARRCALVNAVVTSKI